MNLPFWRRSRQTLLIDSAACGREAAVARTGKMVTTGLLRHATCNSETHLHVVARHWGVGCWKKGWRRDPHTMEEDMQESDFALPDNQPSQPHQTPGSSLFSGECIAPPTSSECTPALGSPHQQRWQNMALPSWTASAAYAARTASHAASGAAARRSSGSWVPRLLVTLCGTWAFSVAAPRRSDHTERGECKG